MALWQVSFLFLPKSLVGDVDEVPEKTLLALDDEVGGFSPTFHLPADYEAQLAQLLPLGKGWAAEMEVWGHEQSDDIQIWRDAGKVASISVRIDVRKLDDVLLSDLLALAERWGGVLVEKRYHKVCRMGLQQFRGLIAGHPHSRAMKDPTAWLPVLVDEVKRSEGKT